VECNIIYNLRRDNHLSDHTHISKVLEWGTNETYDTIPVLYGCTICQDTSEKPFIHKEELSGHSSHNDFVDGCFACKVSTLEFSTGDAGRADSMSQKKWDRELSSYRDARSQGIQPAGTSTAQIQAAHDASDKIGKAYNADSMPSTNKITKRTAGLFKEAGVI
jgi:hypothetical protein